MILERVIYECNILNSKESRAWTREDVQACLDYASRLLANHYSIVPVA